MRKDKYNRRGVKPFSITGEGFISKPSKAGPIGRGGNYIERGSGAALFLLKQGGANVPVVNGAPGSRYLSFSTNGRGSDRDRSEYSPTHYGFKSSGYYKFGKSYNLSFDLRIPNSSSATKGFYYLAQWWQGNGVGPVAGIRLKRGTSHTLQFVKKGTAPGAPRGVSITDVITNYSLKPGAWQRVSINYNIDPLNSGFFNIAVDGKEIGRFSGNIGSRKPPFSYRVKFGIYKQSEQSLFQADFDNIVLS
ncbi:MULTISPECIES: heparin lyase I family protein [Aphanothece]|uniref:heparin lyase I family protein n=1 Tax=Aphanothece TaxID=1121 RepID=UPI0039856877